MLLLIDELRWKSNKRFSDLGLSLSRLNIHISAKCPRRVLESHRAFVSLSRSVSARRTTRNQKPGSKIVAFASYDLNLDLNMRFPRSPCTFRRPQTFVRINIHFSLFLTFCLQEQTRIFFSISLQLARAKLYLLGGLRAVAKCGELTNSVDAN